MANMPFHGKIALALFVPIALLVFDMATRAQQGGDVTVAIKAKSKPATLPTLLVMCDLACNWKLDGDPKGHIDAGRGAKVKVEPGQHMVEASTEDGIDQEQRPTTVKSTGQTMVSIELWPIRYARLVAEKEAANKAAQAAQAKTEQESRGKAEQEVQEKAARERAAKEETEREPWTDPTTGLMWTKKGNGDSVSWQQAMYYCRNLRLAGYDDWRLPTIDELSGINASEANVNGEYLKGDLFPVIEVWSSSQVPGNKGRATDAAWIFQPSRYGPQVQGINLECEGCQVSALCVRRATNHKIP